jgi:hypothetical protein
MKALTREHLALLRAAIDARDILRQALTGRADTHQAAGKAAALLTSGIKARWARGDSPFAIPNRETETAPATNANFMVPGAYQL